MANTTSSSYSFDQDFSIDEIISDIQNHINIKKTFFRRFFFTLVINLYFYDLYCDPALKIP